MTTDNSRMNDNNEDRNDDDHNSDEEINLPDADFSALEEDDNAIEVTAGVTESVMAEIEKLKAESEDHRDKYIRSLAEFENFKKRALKEKSELLKYQGERILFDMLEIIDNLELALQYADADPIKIKEGMDLIHKLFKETLQKWDVKSESALDKEFDPSKQNALSKVPVEGKKAGIVVNEFKKAYFYKDKLLRPAEVVVSDEYKAPEEVEVEEENS